MPYVLCRMVIGSRSTLKITRREYDNIKAARLGLKEIISAEEKFDATMENLVELEESLLTIGVRHLAFFDMDYRKFRLPRNLIGRRISNMLSSARLYRGALLQHIKRILDAQDPAIKQMEDMLKDNAKQPMAYRMMEAVRNYSQHQELPISGITFQRSREEQESATRFAHWLVPLLNARDVSQRRDLKPDVRAALIDLGETANPMGLIREYIEHIGSIHAMFRGVIKKQETDWEQVINSLMIRFRRRFPKEGDLGLAAGRQHRNRTITDPEYLVKESLDYLKYLKTKNLTAVNLSKRYVKWS